MFYREVHELSTGLGTESSSGPETEREDSTAVTNKRPVENNSSNEDKSQSIPTYEYARKR